MIEIPTDVAAACEELCPQLTPKELLSRLKIQKKIGLGGFAVVYRGLLDHKKVAVKVLLPPAQAVTDVKQQQQASHALRMFVREAQALAQCVHPNIVKFYGMVKLPAHFPGLHGFHNSTYAIVLELMTKGSVSELIARTMSDPFSQPYTPSQACEWLHQVAGALAHLHQHTPALVHRDVKLGNVLLTEENGRTVAKLADFGLCTRLDITKAPKTISHPSTSTNPLSDSLLQSTSRASTGAGSGMSLPGCAEDEHDSLASISGVQPDLTAHVISSAGHLRQGECPTIIDDHIPDDSSTMDEDSIMEMAADEDLAPTTISTTRVTVIRGSGSMQDASGRIDFLLTSRISTTHVESIVLPPLPASDRLLLLGSAPIDSFMHPARMQSANRSIQRRSEPLALRPRTPVSQMYTVYSLTGLTGSGMYMAPEVFKGEPYNEKADVFSFGVVMYEMLGRTMLVFTHLHTGHGKQLSSAEQYAQKVAKGYRPNRPAQFDSELWDLVWRCWDIDASKRPSMSEISDELAAAAVRLSSQAATQGSKKQPKAATSQASQGCCAIS